MEVTEVMPQEEYQQHGELVVVCSGKGGIGRTMLSVNLAIAMSKKKRMVSVLDADFQFGDVNMALDLQTNSTIFDMVHDENELNDFNIEQFISVHSSGVGVISAPDRPELADLINIEIIGKTTEILLRENDYVIVDTEVGLQEKSLSIIEKADHILLLTSLEVAALKNTKLMMETFEALELFNKVKIVVNQSTKKGIVTLEDLPEILGTDPFFCLPSNEAVVAKSLNQGEPFVLNNERADIAKACYKLADQLISIYETNGRRKRSSLIPKLFTKKT